MAAFTISGQLADLSARRIYPAEIQVEDGKIISIREVATAPLQYLLPGFTDAHVHIESSMLVPAAFARMAVLHGTVATVSDPHEIANVCGIAGVQYMIDNARQTPFKCFFGAPSCVPATGFETAGAVISAADTDQLLQSPDIWYLAEMMNYPGVLQGDTEVMAKISAARKWQKPVDGHAPGLRGAAAAQYAAAGITTDHECVSLEEALDKIAAGMHILIREGSAAKNFEALHTLLGSHPEKVMLCSDDKHPDDLALHHINELVKRALAKGHDLFDVLHAACVNPVLHYKLPVGLLRTGDPADFIVVDDLSHFNILKTFINGQLVADSGRCLLPVSPAAAINHFAAVPVTAGDFSVRADHGRQLRVIVPADGQLITEELLVTPHVQDGEIRTSVADDLLKIAVINRYTAGVPPAVAFIKHFGLQQGAIASTVAHDCHNIIVAGVDDESMAIAVNTLIALKGGIVVVKDKDTVLKMALPVAGLMTDKDGHEVAEAYAALDRAAKASGSHLRAPFMTLSFMALLVIPALKLSDKGLFDGSSFQFTPLLS